MVSKISRSFSLNIYTFREEKNYYLENDVRND